MFVLAFDSATEVATVALVQDGEVLGERVTTAAQLLAAAEGLLAESAIPPGVLRGIVVGRGPGRYTSLRMGLVTARTLGFALGVPVVGVSTLEALAAGAPGALPVIDARRSEVFVLDGKARCLRPEELEIERGRLCVGDGAVRYRSVLLRTGASIPPDDDPRHIPWARHHVALAEASEVQEPPEPIYLRVPDAEQALARRPA